MVQKFMPIAVVGMSALFPGSKNGRGFWRDIVSGKDLITEVPPSHWLKEDYYDPKLKSMDKVYCTRGSFLDDFDFDPMEYGIPPNNLSATDTTQLLALIATKQLLKDVFTNEINDNDLSKISVILGVTSAQELIEYAASRLQKPIWEFAMSQHGLDAETVKKISSAISNLYVPWQESTFPGLLGNVTAGRICNRFNLGGTNCVCDAACASTLAAISMAVNELQVHQSDMVITGGADTLNSIFMFTCFSQTPALSATGDCRPFSASADGTLLAEGVGLFALKRLDDAERDQNKIYAVIKGVGSSSDGKSKSVYAPVARGQAKSIIRGLQTAGYLPNTVELMEAHGTATLVGDVEEFNGLKLAFRELNASHNQFCAIGSVKSQIGHAKAAAGAAGFFKTVLALSHRILPPTIKISEPNPKLDIEQSPFYLNTFAKPWIRGDDHPRRAGINAFGFGGSNFHIAVEEYRGQTLKAKKWRFLDKELLVFSAANKNELHEKLIDVLKQTFLPDLSLAYLAKLTQLTYQADETCRLAIVCGSVDELRQHLKQLTDKNKHDFDHYFHHLNIYYSPHSLHKKIAFVFPGQTSQYLYMSSDVVMAFNSAMNYWDFAANFPIENNERLHTVVFPQVAFDQQEKIQQLEKLSRTQWTQPAMIVANQAYANLLRTLDLKPDVLLGHSLGEINALAYAQIIPEKDLLAMAIKRGELFSQQEEHTAGGMICVFSSLEIVKKLLDENSIPLEIAHINSPNQIVVSGNLPNLQALVIHLEKQKINFLKLPINRAFHSKEMGSVERSFRDYLNNLTFHPFRIPVYSCAFNQFYSEDNHQIKDMLATQVIKPVFFQQAIESLISQGVNLFIEVGPNQLLTNIIKEIDPNVHAIALDNKNHPLTEFWNGLGHAFVAGLNPNFKKLWDEYEEIEPPSKGATAKFTIKINGTVYGKPYPKAKLDARKSGKLAIMNKGINENEGINEKVNPMTKHQETEEAMHEIVKTCQMIQNNLTTTQKLFEKSLKEDHEAFLAALKDSVKTKKKASSDTAEPKPSPKMKPEMAIQQSDFSNAPSEMPLPPQEMNVMPTKKEPIHVPQKPTTTQSPIHSSDPMYKAMIGIVAEKTGYPETMLEGKMNLEADLGIDSIKRVEILSAMQEKVPSLPELDPSEMSVLNTIDEIVSYIQSKIKSGSPTQQTVPSSTPVASQPAKAAVSAPTASLQQTVDQAMLKIMMDIVSEKTGYPAEMLNMNMNLEADLGIDSIKRVEILSAMQEKVPGLPELDPSEMSTLSTIGEIVAYISSKSGGTTGTASTGTTAMQHNLERSEFSMQSTEQQTQAELFKKKTTS